MKKSRKGGLNHAVEILRRRMHKIDIVIPAFNPGKYLTRCLRSVSNQRYPEKFRIILVDDGSTEKLLPFLKEFKNLSILYLRQEKNGGAASARNIGIQNSTAELIFFLDADDEMAPDRLLLTTQAFENNPALMMVCGNFRWMIEEMPSSLCFSSPPEIYYATMLVHFPVHTSTVSVRREIFDLVGLFNEEYVVGEDYDLWVRIAKQFPERIHYIHEELARYHWCSHPNSLTSRFRHTKTHDEIFNTIRTTHGLL